MIVCGLGHSCNPAHFKEAKIKTTVACGSRHSHKLTDFVCSKMSKVKTHVSSGPYI